MTDNFEPGHILAEALKPDGEKKVCPKCGKDFRHWHVEDYDEIWRDGKVVCECGQFIRDYDAG